MSATRGVAPTLRRLTADDLGLLADWLAEPYVARWWNEDADPLAVAARYGPSIEGDDPTELWLGLLNGQPFAFAQSYRLADTPAWAKTLAVADVPAASAGIDYLIGRPALTGRGLGPLLIRNLVDRLWEAEPALDAVVVGVSRANRPSWRALEHAGFSRWWTGELESEDPSDQGPQFVYLHRRPDGPLTPSG